MAETFSGIECPECCNYYRVQRAGQHALLYCPYCGRRPSPANSKTENCIDPTSPQLAEQLTDNQDTLDVGVKELETEILCEECGFCFVVYGFFTACPKCGPQYSAQFFEANFNIVRRGFFHAESLE